MNRSIAFFLFLAACHPQVERPITDEFDRTSACETVALEETEEVKDRCDRLFAYREAKAPLRRPIQILDRCAQSPSGNVVRYGLLGQTDRAKIRRVYFISAGLQGIFVNNQKGGRPNALTGQPGGHEELPCDAATILSADSLLSIVWNDPRLYDPQDTLVVAVFVTGGRIQIRDQPDNYTMVSFWKDFLQSRLDPARVRSIVYAGMSLGGALSLGLSSELDDAFPKARHVLVAMAPVGRRKRWIFPVDRATVYKNPAGENSKGVTRLMQNGWYAHHLTAPSLWSKNVTAGAWLSGAPKLGYREAWNSDLGPIRWNHYTHEDMGSTFHPEVQVDQANFIRRALGIRPDPDPVLDPRSRVESEACIERTYLPAWERAYRRCMRQPAPVPTESDD